MTGTVQLVVDGAVRNPQVLTCDDLSGFDEQDHERDVSRFHPTRRGDGVTLQSLLKRVDPVTEANYLTLHAGRDDFAASIPLDAIREEGILVYSVDGEPLDIAHGGPFRFLIRNPAACRTDELDDCANVKYVDRIELSVGRGRDTRPTDEEEHAALHDHDS